MRRQHRISRSVCRAIQLKLISLGGPLCIAGGGMYVATKAAVEAISEGAASLFPTASTHARTVWSKELADFNVSCMSVVVSSTPTSQQRSQSPSAGSLPDAGRSDRQVSGKPDRRLHDLAGVAGQLQEALRARTGRPLQSGAEDRPGHAAGRQAAALYSGCDHARPAEVSLIQRQARTQ
jgi:hypothetical protein